MKKQIIAGIAVAACVALCAAVWPQSAEVKDLPAEPEKAAVTTKFEAWSEKMPPILLSTVVPALEAEAVTESEPEETEITAEKETESVQPAESTPHTVSKSAPATTEPKSGDKTVIDGKPYIWIPGFEWIEDHSGESVGTFAADMYENGNKIGVMGGRTMVGNPGDELTGNKVGIMGGTVGSSGDINKQVGIMGGEESTPCNPTPPPSEQPEPTGDVIYIELQPPVTKDSTPPPYKPNGEPINP